MIIKFPSVLNTEYLVRNTLRRIISFVVVFPLLLTTRNTGIENFFR